MKNRIFISLAIAGIVAFSGCGSSDVSDITDSFSDQGGHNGSDSLTLQKTSGDNFKIIWDKQSSGYSEIVIGNYKEDKRGRYILTSNTTRKQTLDCVVQYATNQEAMYRCTNDNPIASNYREATVSLISDKGYDFWINKTTSLNKQSKSATLIYDGSTHSIDIN